MNPRNNEKKQETIRKRQAKEQESLLEHLKQSPVVAVACKRAGVSRATYYRWRKDNWTFAEKADAALREGELFTNDMMEWVVIEKAVKEKNLAAAKFWLSHHHEGYKSSWKWGRKSSDSEKMARGVVELVRGLERETEKERKEEEAKKKEKEEEAEAEEEKD